MHRVHRGQHFRSSDERGHAEDGEATEPREGDGPEQRTEGTRAPALQREDPDENGNGQRDHVRFEDRRGDGEALDGAEHGDGGGDHPVSVEERGAEEPEEKEAVGAPALCCRRHRQCHEREDASLTPVVRAQDEHQILDRDDENERPGGEGEDAEHVRRGRLDRVMAAEAFPERVQRARPDVPVDDPQGEHQCGQVPWSGRAATRA